jgi:HSP20 family protein
MTVLKMYNKNGFDNAVSSPVFTFSELMNEFFNQKDYNSAIISSVPRVNILEEKETFIFNLAIPGVNKTDIKMQVDKNLLTITHSSEISDNEVSYSRKEFDYGNFERTFHLPETVDVLKIKAKYDDGILRIEIPKKKEAIEQGPKEIKIS